MSAGISLMFSRAKVVSSSPPSSTMLTSRGAVARLSRRAVNSKNKTNAFFSTAAVVPRVSLPAQAKPQQRTAARPSSSASTPGQSISFEKQRGFVYFSSSSLICHGGKGRRRLCKNRHRCCRRRPVRDREPPPHFERPRGPGLLWRPARPRSRVPLG